MTKIFLLSFLALTSLTVSAQTKKVKLIKANTGNPAEYIRQLRVSGKLTINRNLEKDAEMDIEKDKNYNFKKTGGLKTKQNTMFEVTNDRPQLSEQPRPAIASLLVVNKDLEDRGGPDPMVAVGEEIIAVSNTGWIRFYNKGTGKSVFTTSATGLFERYFTPTINGAPNPDYASNFYNIPADLPYWCSKSAPCATNTTGTDPVTGINKPCPEETDEGVIQTAYDTRVFYQKEHKRFVVVSALRNESSRDHNQYNVSGDRDCEQYLIRLVGIAVSVSEDPNDGFHIYRTGENNYRDWPNAVLDKDYLVIANKSGDEKSNGHSIVTVYNFQQMKDGVGPTIDGFSILQDDAQNTPQTVVPVSNFLTNYMSEAFFFLQNKGTGSNKARIWYIKKPATPAAIFSNPPTALTLAGELSVSGADFVNGGNMGLVYHSKAIYFVTHQKFEDATNSKKAGYGINYYKIPVIHKSNNTYEVSQNADQGFVHQVFSSDNYSYLNPSIAVDAFKNLAMQFVRVGRSKTSGEKPQIRYKVKFVQDADWRSSILSKEWGIEEDADYVEEKGKLTDYSYIVKDPYKISVFYLAHKISATGTSGVYIGKVDLASF